MSLGYISFTYHHQFLLLAVLWSIEVAAKAQVAVGGSAWQAAHMPSEPAYAAHLGSTNLSYIHASITCIMIVIYCILIQSAAQESGLCLNCTGLFSTDALMVPVPCLHRPLLHLYVHFGDACADNSSGRAKSILV